MIFFFSMETVGWIKKVGIMSLTHTYCPLLGVFSFSYPENWTLERKCAQLSLISLTNCCLIAKKDLNCSSRFLWGTVIHKKNLTKPDRADKPVLFTLIQRQHETNLRCISSAQFSADSRALSKALYCTHCGSVRGWLTHFLSSRFPKGVRVWSNTHNRLPFTPPSVCHGKKTHKHSSQGHHLNTPKQHNDVKKIIRGEEVMEATSCWAGEAWTELELRVHWTLKPSPTQAWVVTEHLLVIAEMKT